VSLTDESREDEPDLLALAADGDLDVVEEALSGTGGAFQLRLARSPRSLGCAAHDGEV
jgi:hypothetical protein